MLNSHSALLPTALLLALSAASLPTSSAAAAHAYRVALADDLGSLAVEARLAGAVNSLKARQLGSSRYLRDPRLCDDSPLQVRQQTLRLPPGENLCVRYEVDLAELARQRAYRRGSYGTLDRLTSPAAWLWQPPLSQGGEIQVTFDLPAGVDVSVPWTPLADRVDKAFRFGASPESSNAIVVFGGFAYRELAVPGATLRVSVLRMVSSRIKDKGIDLDEHGPGLRRRARRSCRSRPRRSSTPGRGRAGRAGRGPR